MCWKSSVVLSYLLANILSIVAVSDVSIIVVGSGPSGIAAATKLLENNFTNVLILEAENRIGGRINSIKFGEAFVDLGAEFCHGEEGNIVYSMTHSLNILKHSEDWKGGFQFYLSNGKVVDEKVQRRIMSLAHSLLASKEPAEGCEKALSVGDCLRLKSSMLLHDSSVNRNEQAIISESIDWVHSYICSFDSTFDLNDLNSTTEYRICSGDLRLNWNGLGYKTILDVMMKKYPKPENQLQIDDKIKLGKVVKKISGWKNGSVTIASSDGTVYQTDHVIFTASVGVLKHNHADLFDPVLTEEKVEAINGIGFGAIVKVILQFPERWWDQPELFAFIWTFEDKETLKQENLEWLINLRGFSEAENNSKVLIAWYAGKHVPEIENLSEERILLGHNYVIEKFLSAHYNSSKPNSIIWSKWYTNSYFRGTYSFELTNTSRNSNFQEKLAAPLINKDGKPTVLFAGEASHSYYFSTVHGAIETGYREAERIIQFYKNSD